MCLVLHTVLNFVIGQGMGGKNVSAVWKISIKLLNNPNYEVGIILFSPEHILCSNVKRANIFGKCPSLFSFWINMSQRIFGGELSILFLLLVTYLSWS